MVYNKQLVSTGTPKAFSHNRHCHYGRLSETDSFWFTEIPCALWNTVEKQNTLNKRKAVSKWLLFGFSGACHRTVFSRAFYWLHGCAFPAFFTGYISSRFSRPFHRRIDCFVLLAAKVVSHVQITCKSRHCLCDYVDFNKWPKTANRRKVGGKKKEIMAKCVTKQQQQQKTEFEFAERYWDKWVIDHAWDQDGWIFLQDLTLRVLTEQTWSLKN